MIQKLVLKDNTTFQEAVRLLDAGGVGILPVVDANNKLIGIITDGDIRRALLAGEQTLEKVINRSPKTVLDNVSRHEILALLKQHHLRHMPVVDKENNFKHIVLLDGLYVEDQPNRVIIMAGGLGTRLGELTKETPKPMLPVGGKPVLERIINEFADKGFRKFTICLNYKAEIIRDYFGNGNKWHVEIEYTHEKNRMGTAGAITLIEKEKLAEPFFVINGDVLTQIDYTDYMQGHRLSGAIASMAVKQYEEYIPYACVKFDESTGELQYIAEKPRNIHHINAGVYILTSDCIPYIPQDSYFDMPSLFDTLLREAKKVKVYKMEEHWIDIGYPDDYKKANNLFDK